MSAVASGSGEQNSRQKNEGEGSALEMFPTGEQNSSSKREAAIDQTDIDVDVTPVGYHMIYNI